MVGIFGGEKAKDQLLTFDNVIKKMERRVLPKIGHDTRPAKNGQQIKHFGGHRRAASIPPKTAATQAMSPQNVHSGRLQSLVNNNTFLGRGTFGQNRGSLVVSPNSN